MHRNVVGYDRSANEGEGIRKSLVKATAAGLAVCAATALAAVPATAKTHARHARHHTAVHRRHAKHARAVGGTYLGLPVTPGSGYVALGDSVTFGYKESQVVPTPDYTNAANFPNYPQMLGQELHLTVANLACPGETSSSLIDTSAVSNGCENTLGDPTQSYRGQFPLHYSYTGSQLSAAVAYIEANPNVRLVSLMIGANDVFVCQAQTSDGCASTKEKLQTAALIAKNVGTILSTIRNTAHYTGQIAIVNYYSLDYANSSDNQESQLGNTVVDLAAAPYHVVDADGYGTFGTASVDSGNDPCTAGLLTQLGAPGSCGIHPSFAGQALLAQSLLNAIKT
jgi:lysophospholipase L1-like esterase